MLVSGLPFDAALYRSMPDSGGWTITDHLLATVVDMLGQTAHSALIGPHLDPKKLRGMKRPEPMRRPGSPAPAPKARTRMTIAELEATFSKG